MGATNFIYGETLVGVVDGVNKVFISLYPIDKIESLRLGGVEYSLFSFVGNTVTLTDAPTVNTGAPDVDYFRSDVVVPVPAGNVTFIELINSIFLRIGQDNTSYQFPIELVKEYVVEAITTHTNKRINPVRNTGIYTFNKSEDGVVSTYSPSEVNVGTVGVYVPSNGMAMIDFQGYFNYGSKTASSLTSISNLSHIYSSSSQIRFGYALPVGVKKPSEVSLDGVILTYVDYREFTSRNQRNEYTVYNGYLFLPRTSSSAIVSVSFVKDTVIPSLDTDVVDFEQEYLKVLKLYVMKEVYADREEDRFAVTEKRYREAWVEYKSYISRQTDGINNTIASSAFRNL